MDDVARSRHAWLSASRLSKIRYTAGAATPSSPATAEMVNESIPREIAASTTSSKSKRGFGPVFRPAVFFVAGPDSVDIGVF